MSVQYKMSWFFNGTASEKSLKFYMLQMFFEKLNNPVGLPVETMN